MNDYSHYLDFNNRVQEQEARAAHDHLAYQHSYSVYKKWVANVGTALVHMGTSLQNYSEFELDTKFSTTSEEC